MSRILILLAWALAVLCASAHAALDPALVKPLGGEDADARVAAIARLGALGTPEAFALLNALNEEKLYATPEGRVLIVEGDKATDPLTGETLAFPEGADSITVNNRLRRELESALAGLRLFADDVKVRLKAAQEVQQNAGPDQLPMLEKALDKETDARVRNVLDLAVATINLKSDDAAKRKSAVERLALNPNASIRPVLAAMIEPKSDGTFTEPDADVRAAVAITLGKIDRHLAVIEWSGNLFYGLSLASVLLLAALGLAITFGLMGIINMAHGELLMVGAYSTYMVQIAFKRWFPAHFDWYVVAAVPTAFVITAVVGMILERTVIRWLYGRPLETLLATWGISLALMQTVRTIFGAQNVEVANPSWMSGGVTVLGGLVLTYNRMVIIGFAIFVVAVVWALLNKTRLGLFVRAVTQNRRMADCVGVPTGRVDMLTFGLGSGIAGLGGVALSQLGNVGPDLGQSYIVDSFLVVVLGGVGQLAGTVIAAFGLGELNKFLEPYAGAVLAKIAILVLIVLFIQKRPQGLFALKGRSAD
ncbi:MAG TPA: urea ABC transporter permease subunit UrtB [Burkholderiales bacterium]|nr:urea ABC transporter permease subunit UrtB [Burkholderiales bacterium]